MRCWPGSLLGVSAALALLMVGASALAQSYPYEGVWGANREACRDRDGVERMHIAGKRFSWYETRCQASEIKPQSATAWTMQMVCEGEGEKFRARPRLTLPTRNRLIMDGEMPVGPTKRQVYVRCEIGRRK